MNKYMTMEEIYEGVLALSHSQGFYGRVAEAMKENWDDMKPHLENKFTDIVDFVLFMEQ